MMKEYRYERDDEDEPKTDVSSIPRWKKIVGIMRIVERFNHYVIIVVYILGSFF